jgi:type IV pilus assembly protein PilX
MNTANRSSRKLLAGSAYRNGQRGIALVFTLIAVLVLLLSSIALVRSFTNATLVAGSLAFKRDVVNQSERGLNTVTAFFATGALQNPASRIAPNTLANYSPCVLPSDARGIPIILQDDANFAGTTDTDATHDPQCGQVFTSAANDITDATTNVTIRYVIDRLCINTQQPQSGSCIVSQLGDPLKAQVGNSNQQQLQVLPVYRVTVRVISGNVRTFVQSTMTM